ncbi:MAG: cytochrome-ba3 oxidase subunit [Halorientalis sp.]
MTGWFGSLSPRIVAAIGLLALVPVATFGITKSISVPALVTVTNVILITASLYMLFSPTEAEKHGSGTAHS